MAQTGPFRYVGPAELRDRRNAEQCAVLDGPTVLGRWLAGREPGEREEPFTFVVTLDGVLRLAARRSEHVALAEGHDVLAAGEMTFGPEGPGWCVTGVSNQSTGYCPDPGSWPAVAAALDRAGVRHPGGFTDTIVFRRCPDCGGRNIVRDDDFTCALCDGPLLR